jgi:hypothetical protein
VRLRLSAGTSAGTSENVKTETQAVGAVPEARRFKDVVSRFKDVVSRFKEVVRRFKDVVSRFKDVVSRLNVKCFAGLRRVSAQLLVFFCALYADH